MNPWGRATQQYVVALTAAHRSAGTIRLHRHYLAQLVDVRPSPWSVTLGDLREVMAGKGWGADAMKSARSVYRGFYRWAVDEGYLEVSPAEKLAAIKAPAPEPRPTPEAMVRELLRNPSDRVVFMGLLASQLGLRCAEVAQVHEADYTPGRLIVHGKGGKRRTAFVESMELLDRLAGLSGWAFPGLTDGHLSPGHVSKLLSRALPPGWTGHTLRHRAATEAHTSTGNIYAVSKMLGHSNVATTQRYVAVSDQAVRAAYRAAAA